MNTETSVRLLKANDYTIEKFFNEKTKIMVPIYQRNYSWEVKNMETLIKDIYNNEKYYVGNIMTIAKGSDKKIDIIDGQQRLISIFLIFCALKNEFGISEISSFLKKGKKFEVEKRSSDSDNKLLQYIFDNDIADNFNNKKEVKAYRRVKKYIDKHNLDPERLYRRTKQLIIVDIKFISNETDAHNTFVNLNTKGISLDNVEILKSQLFKFLAEDTENGMQYYKNGWYETVYSITEENMKRYFDDFTDLYLDVSSERKVDQIVEHINSLEKAKKFYNAYRRESDEKNGLCCCAQTVYNHSVDYINSIFDGNISLESLDSYLKLFKSAKFSQFNIVLIALFNVKDRRDKNRFIQNYPLIMKFIKLVLMHQAIMSINNLRPSIYGNNFKIIAKKIYDTKDYKGAIKTFLTENFSMHSTPFVKDTLRKIQIDHDNTHYARQVLQLLNEIVNIDMTTEHFLSLESRDAHAKMLGNCIPVKTDIYGTDLERKLVLYEENASSEPYIKLFLEDNVTLENYIEKIEERTENIVSEFSDMYEGLYVELSS